MKKIYLLILALLSFMIGEAGAQSYTITTPTTATISITGAITFGFKNTNPYPVKITSLSMFIPVSTTATYTLWYHPSVLTGAPTISLANGWLQAGSSLPNPAADGIQPAITGLNFIIPANTIYRFAVQSSGNVYYTNTGLGADYFTANGVEIYTQANPVSPTYVGNFPSPPTTPRGFMGSITFERIASSTDNAGTSLVSPAKFCGANQPLRVRVANSGTNPISTVTLQWELNGSLQPSVQINGTLDALNGPAANDTIIELGMLAFAQNTPLSLRIWTSMPNGTNDPVTSNDTTYAFLKQGMSGTYTIGGISPDYAGFASAMNDIDKYGVCGPLTFEVAAGSTFMETPVTLKNLEYPVTFRKIGTGANPLVTGYGGIGTVDAVFTISGSSNIVFDGIDVADSPSTVSNNRMEYGYKIVNSVAVKGSSNNIIRNCKITLQRANTNSSGIMQSTSSTGGGVAATTSAGANNNNRYENIKVENAYKGITLIGTAGYPDSGCVITSSGGDTTIIGAPAPNDIGNGTTAGWGVSIADQLNAEISKIIVRNVTHTGTSTLAGIFIDNGSTNTSYGTSRVYGNMVYNVLRSGSATVTGTVTGIRVDVSPSAGADVYNNIIFNVTSATGPAAASATVVARGIAHGITTGTGNARYFNNSVSITGNHVNVSSAAFWKGGTGIATSRNNIYSNSSAAQAGVAKHYGFYLSAGSVVASNNVFWTPNTNGIVGYSTSDRATLPLFAAATSAAAPSDGNEIGSAYGDPNFISATDLNIGGITPAAQSGIPVLSPAITTDLYGTVRSTTRPSIGAVETPQLLLDSSAPVITNVIARSGANPSAYATVNDNSLSPSAGSIVLWYRAGTSGAFTALAPDSIPSGSISGTYKWDIGFNSLTLGDYQFYIAVRDQVSPGVNIAFNPVQSAAFTGFSATDPANYLSNPDAGVNVRTISKLLQFAGGTYPVGASSLPFTNLTQVAAAINGSDITGNLLFELQQDYNGTTETFPVIFKEFAATGGNWTVTIRPAAAATGLVTSGAPNTGDPMITLDGVKNLFLDGRPGGTGTSGEWLIRNRRSASVVGSCISFVNSAQRNSLNYLKLQSASTLGTVLFSTSSKTTGNRLNYIGNCEIRDRSDSIGAPTFAIASTGTSGVLNDSNTIENNNIFNFITTGVSLTATGNGNGWVINANHFYNNRIPAPAVAQQSINIAASTTAGHILSNNYIGGSQPFCGGSPWINTGATSIRGISLNLATTDSTYIRNNTIQNIQCTSTGSGSLWCTEITAGTISFSGNMIGHPTNANSLLSNMSALTAGMYLQGSGSMRIYNNTFANIISGSTTSTLGLSCINSSVTGSFIITDNIIHDLYFPGIATSLTSSALRIIYSTGTANHVISGNTIYAVKCTGGPAGTVATMAQVVFASGAGTGILNGNKLYGISNSTANATGQLVGFNLTGGAWNVSNNFISLGDGTDSAAMISGITVASPLAVNLYHNTISVSGASLITGGTQVSAGIRRTSAGNVNLINNIISNTRSGGASNYAVANTNSSPAVGWKANFNDLYSTNASQAGLWNSTPLDLVTWKTTTLHDTASISIAPVFISGTDLHLSSGTLGNFSFAGKPLTGYETDIDGETRSAVFPYMGADESVANRLVPVKLMTFTAKRSKDNAVLAWQTASENNAGHFEAERSLNGKDFKYVSAVDAKGTTSQVSSYSCTDYAVLQNTSTVYYRLKMVDKDGKAEYSKIVSVSKDNENTVRLVTYPNPFSDAVSVDFTSPENADASVTIYDIAGKPVITLTQHASAGTNTLHVDQLEKLRAGIYLVTIEINGEKQAGRLLKK